MFVVDVRGVGDNVIFSPKQLRHQSPVPKTQPVNARELLYQLPLFHAANRREPAALWCMIPPQEANTGYFRGVQTYRNIAWNLEAARSMFWFYVSLWNLAGVSTALLWRRQQKIQSDI